MGRETDLRDEIIARQQACIKDYLNEIARLEAALDAADTCAVRGWQAYYRERRENGHKCNLDIYNDLTQCKTRLIERANGRYTGVSDTNGPTVQEKVQGNGHAFR